MLQQHMQDMLAKMEAWNVFDPLVVIVFCTHLWMQRDNFCQLSWEAVKEKLCALTTVLMRSETQGTYKNDLNEFRLNHLKTIIFVLNSSMVCSMILRLLRHQIGSSAHRLVVCVFCAAGIILSAMGPRWTRTGWHIDAYAVLGFCFEAWNSLTLPPSGTFLTHAPQRSSFCLLVGILLADFRKGALCQGVVALINIYRFPELDAGSFLSAGAGMQYSYAITEFTCLVTNVAVWYTVGSALKNQWSARVGKETSEITLYAARNLLSVLCDADVFLRHDYRIVGPCLKLCHILLKNVGNDLNGLDGVAFPSLLFDDDQTRFADFMQACASSSRRGESSQSEGGQSVPKPPSSLHVHLRDAAGLKVKVELVHAIVRDVLNPEKPSHLLCLREASDDFLTSSRPSPSRMGHSLAHLQQGILAQVEGRRTVESIMPTNETGDHGVVLGASAGQANADCFNQLLCILEDSDPRQVHVQEDLEYIGERQAIQSLRGDVSVRFDALTFGVIDFSTAFARLCGNCSPGVSIKDCAGLSRNGRFWEVYTHYVNLFYTGLDDTMEFDDKNVILRTPLVSSKGFELRADLRITLIATEDAANSMQQVEADSVEASVTAYAVFTALRLKSLHGSSGSRSSSRSGRSTGRLPTIGRGTPPVLPPSNAALGQERGREKEAG